MLKRNFIPNIDWFDRNFTTSFLYEDLPIKKQLNEKRFRLEEEQVSSRVLNHWQELGVIIENREKGKGWRKFSISELIWISIVVKLRRFGLDLEKIKSVRTYLDTYNNSKSQSDCPLLDFYITYALSASMPVSLLVFDSGEAMFLRQIEFAASKDLGLIKDDFISIDLSQIVSNIFKNRKQKTDYLDFSTLPIEKEVRASLRAENIQSISIKVNNGDQYLVEKEILFDSIFELNEAFQKFKYAKSTVDKKGGNKIYRLFGKEKIKK